MAEVTLHIRPYSEITVEDDDAFESGFEQDMWDTRRNPEGVLLARQYKESMIECIKRVNKGGW